MEPQFDRFDIAEVHSLIESDFNQGGVLQERPSNQRRRMSTGAQLHRMKARNLAASWEHLTPNGRLIYLELLQRYGLPFFCNNFRHTAYGSDNINDSTTSLTFASIDDEDDTFARVTFSFNNFGIVVRVIYHFVYAIEEPVPSYTRVGYNSRELGQQNNLPLVFDPNAPNEVPLVKAWPNIQAVYKLLDRFHALGQIEREVGA